MKARKPSVTPVSRPFACPHCGAGKRFRGALCGHCMRFSDPNPPSDATEFEIEGEAA